MTDQKLMLIFTAGAALGSFLAAMAAWRSARATKQVAEAQLYSAQYAEYGSADMLRSLRILRQWHSDYGPDFVVKWLDGLKVGEKAAQDVDYARRQVKNYFLRAVRLHKAKYVSSQFVKQIGSVGGINVLYSIVEPMERALDLRAELPHFELLRKLCGPVGTGELLPAIPPFPRSDA